MTHATAHGLDEKNNSTCHAPPSTPAGTLHQPPASRPTIIHIPLVACTAALPAHHLKTPNQFKSKLNVDPNVYLD